MHRSLLPLDILVGIFALTALTLGVTPSYDPALSYPVQMGIIVAVFVYFALAHGVSDWQMGYLVGRALMLAGTVFAAGVILQYDYQHWGETPAFIMRAGALTTLLPDLGLDFRHPNAVATFLEIMFPLGIVLIITSRQPIERALWIISLLLCAFALVLTFSRGAFVGLALTAIIAALVLSRRWRVRIPALLLLIVGTAGVLLTTAGADWVLSRWTLYRNSLFVASDYLFTGIGLGDTFPLIYSRYGLLIQVPQLTYAHNLVLSVWMGQGLPGLLAFGALVITLYLFVRKVLVQHPRRLFHAAWLGVTVNLIHGLFDSRQYVEAIWLMPTLFGLIGLTVGLGRLAVERRTHHVRYVPWRAAAAAALVLVVGAVIFNREVRAAWYTNRGALLETRTELNTTFNAAQRQTGYEEASEFYQHALDIAPMWPNANRRLGNLYAKMGLYTEAIPQLETALMVEPENTATIKGLGLAYTWSGRSADAAQQFLQLPDPAEVNEELTQWGFYWGSEQNQPLLSAYAYETAAAMYPENVSIPIWQAAADAYRDAGHTGEARAWYERILAQEPDNQRVAHALADINGQ